MEPFPAYPSGNSWDEAFGKTGSGEKFLRNAFREPIHSTADARHVPRELEVVAREWESLNVEIVRDSELARMHRDDTVARQ